MFPWDLTNINWKMKSKRSSVSPAVTVKLTERKRHLQLTATRIRRSVCSRRAGSPESSRTRDSSDFLNITEKRSDDIRKMNRCKLNVRSVSVSMGGGGEKNV